MKNRRSEGTDLHLQETPPELGLPNKTQLSQIIDDKDELPVVGYLKHRQKEVLEAYDRGDITDVTSGDGGPIEELVSHFLRNGFLKSALRLFPDPRKNYEVPMECLLLAPILQRLNDKHSLLLAPYLLNSGSLITELGYNPQILQEGFNQRNKYERKTAFHGETLKHVLNAVDSEGMMSWWNEGLFASWQEQAKLSVGEEGVTRKFILDGMKIEVPAHLKHKYVGAGTVKNDDGTYSHGYKVVWMQQVLIPKKRKPKKILSEKEREKEARLQKPRGILVGLRIGPIEEHDQSLGKWLLQEFPFEAKDELIFDRGFIDGNWFDELHEKKGIEIFVPIRRNMKITKEAVLKAQEHPEEWKPHPTRKDQWIQTLHPDDLKSWSECQSLKSGVMVRWKDKEGVFDEVVFVSTKENLSPEEILATYDLRSRIEETHRQLKIFQGIETLPSKKWEQVIFGILMGIMAFNLLTLYLLAEHGEDLEEAKTIKTLKQKREYKKEPNSIVYTETAFAVLPQRSLLVRTLKLEDPLVRKKLVMVLDRPED